jgi:hypothetical protein
MYLHRNVDVNMDLHVISYVQIKTSEIDKTNKTKIFNIIFLLVFSLVHITNN